MFAEAFAEKRARQWINVLAVCALHFQQGSGYGRQRVFTFSF
jgi:hypothetical protein